MDRIVTLQVPERLVVAVERLLDKLPVGSSQVWISSLIGVLGAIAVAWWTSRIHQRATDRMLEHQRKMELEKQKHVEAMEQHLSTRKHLESAYQELLSLERWAAKMLTDTTARSEAVNLSLYPTEIGAIRMHFDLIDARELLTSFSAIDARHRDFFATMMILCAIDTPASPRDPKRGEKLIYTFQALATAIDTMKVGIRLLLAPALSENSRLTGAP